MAEPAVGSEAGAATVAELLRFRAAERPEQVAFTFLMDGESEGGRVTYGELDRRASAIASALSGACRPGDRALLLYPPGLDFIAAFFGCLYAGVVAVPAYPPRPNDRSQSRLRAIAHDATPRAALTTEALLAGTVEPRGLLAVAPELAGLRWIATDGLSAAGPASFRFEPQPESVAFLQYTSGSTAAPKGVMVTHANLLHNERMIGAAFGMDAASVVVGWLPLYHDMGLIGNVLQPLHAGASCVLMSPVAFLQRPLRWLEAISRYRGTTSGGPNFAYELCVRKASPEALAGLDLSSWRVAYNGAEPVRASTLERFAAAFAPSGFRAAAFYPCYGLAEATLFVTGGHGAEVERERVSCGRTWMDQRVLAVDPDTRIERPVGAEGEIWVSGPSVARGYWENPEATAADFHAFLATGEGPFLRTGDLGFLAGGELYVTGRRKDLIILRGRNLYPQDVELTAEGAHPDLLPGGGAAFSVEIGGEERLVIVHEVSRHLREGIEAVAEAVRRAVAAEHEAQVHEVVLIRQAGLPKTSSGKVQRRRCRELYLAGELPVVGRSALVAEGPASDPEPGLTPEALAALEPGERRERLEDYLRGRAAASLGVPASAVGLDQPLTGLGLDSLSAIELKGAVESALGLSLPLAELLQGASARDLAALAGAAGAEELPPLRALAVEGDTPLSPGQRGLWFLHRLAPEGGAYNIAVAARAVGGLDLAALVRALAALAVRHEALRTVFPLAGDEPVQRVLPDLEPDVQILTDLDRLAAEAWRPFLLDAGPLLRARVFVGAGEPVLLLVVHHIVADFASLAVMARDLAALYRGEALPPPALRYADYVRWQGELLAGRQGERSWAYWRHQLAGVPDLDLPVDHPRPPVQTWRGDARAVTIPPSLTAALGALGAGRGATPFMALLAAFQAQLARYTGQEDFAVGSPVAGRPLPELAGLVGYFVNTLPLRADLAGSPGFGALLERARQVALAGMEHGGFPFPTIAERLRPVRDPARSPVFQAVLVLQSARPGDPAGLAAFSLGEEARVELEGLTLEAVRLPERRAPFDLTLLAAEDGHGGLGLSLEFNTDLFDGGTAERMLGHLRTLLEGATAAPETPVWHLPLLTAGERRQLLAEWNPAPPAVASPRLALHQRFEAQVDRAPEAVALSFGEERLTYGELDARANRLARHLQAQGVRPGDRVALLLERSAEMVVALLAVLKAGAAYVPVDPAYPQDRIAFTLEDSEARLVLRAEDLAAEEIARRSPGRPAVAVDPELPAYVIYTSGSTGRPKGVVVTHANAERLFSATEPWFGFGADDVWTLFHSYAFDFSVWEIWGALLYGGRLVVVPYWTSRSPEAFYRLLREERVTVLSQTPSAFRQLLWAEESALGDAPPELSLRWVVFGGEALEPASLAPWFARHGDERPRLINMYGITETTVHVTWRPVVASDLESGSRIGRPIPDLAVYLLDRSLEPAPVGVAGEIHVGGAGLAQGYLGRPELTAERFVPDPFAAVPGSRLYRSGDLARRLADGDLEYLGRIDHQVKIRGFRIELGEIEAALSSQPGVREAVVLTRDDGQEGERRLVAWVAGEGLEAAALRRALGERLPDVMIPAAFVLLDALPLTGNGKVDRRALPAPVLAGANAPAAFRTPVEELLAGLVAEVLGIERVGRQDDFFALGGHSLLATRLLARASRLFGVDLPVSSVFLHPTVAALAERIAAASGEEMAPPVLPAPRPPDGALPLSFGQQRLWLLDQIAPGSPAYHLPGALQISGPLDLDALEAAFAGVVARHDALRTVFRIEAGEPMQTLIDLPSGLPRIDLAALPPEAAAAEADRLTREAAVAPFDLARGPLWRALALRLGAAEHLLAITLHHIVADGWSLEILVAELAALYAAFTAGLPSPLPVLPVQYADWAVWQRERLTGDRLAAQVEWWREQLDGAPALELPADHPRPAVRSERGGTRATVLPAAVSLELERLARREGATPFMVLLAAFQAQLARYTGAPSVPVGSPVANRSRAEVEGVIGFFVNMLVLRTPAGGDPSFRELLGRVREVCLGAYAHQDVPFERLVEELRPERQRGRNPLFQIAFQVEEPLAVERLGEAAVRVSRLATGTAKFDLALSVVREREGFAATLEYDADLFDAATAERILGHWRTLAAGIAEDPGAHLSGLPLLTPTETAQIAGWTGGATDYPREATIHGLFAEQAERTPEAVAVEFGAVRLSYGELEARANRLARRLRRLGVGSEVPVGLCLERSAGLIVAMLGVLKAGGAYVPLDPGYPEERLAFLVADTGLSTIVIREGSEAVLPSGLARVPLGPEGELLQGPEEGGEPLPDLTGPLGLAYIIYTSGSTGRPKGVEAVHRAVVRLVRGTGYAPFGPGEVFLHLAPPAFDAATYEVWGALLNGGRVAVLPGGAPSLAELEEALARHGVTSLFLTTGLFHQMAELRLEGLRGLRSLLAGGDVISPALMRRAVEGLPGCRVADVYGPTENTTFSTCQPLPAAAGVPSPVPIGRPIANSTVQVLDAAFHPVPVGVPGDLYTGGDGLARGYRGRPELTAERFVPGLAAGERLYATGDLARWRPGGALEFLGRRDQQVKIRGFRVEPSEVEAVLASHPGVADVAVVVREETGGKALAAFVVPRRGEALPEGLREHLRAALPEYMLPAHLVACSALPLNASAKVDRRALALRDVRSGAREPDHQPPRTPAEERLAAIWSEVLGVERIGIHDDFFALGGHSLLAIRALARIGEAFDVDLPVSDLFAAPTVAALAERIAGLDASGGPARQPALRTGEVSPLSFAQQRLWLLDRLEPGGAGYNVPVAVRLEGPLNVGAMTRAVAAIVGRHEPLRTVYGMVGEEPVQVVLPAAGVSDFPFARVDLRGLPAAARERTLGTVLRAEGIRPFDLARGPVSRFLLIDLAAEDRVLLATIHHIATDGWSMSVFFRELAALYADFAAGWPASLPALPQRYADWALGQRAALDSGALDAQLDYWRQQLAGLPVLELPADRPRGPETGDRGALRPVEIPTGLTEPFRGQGSGITPFTVLLAGYLALLARLGGQDDLAVGIPAAGRRGLQTEGMIGFFVNTLVIRPAMEDDPGFAALLGRVRDAVLAAQAHQDVPFERLVEELQPERTAGVSPFFQAMFAYLANPLAPVAMPGVALTLLDVETATAQYDLTLSVYDEGEGLRAWMEHRTALFDPATVDRWTGHLRELLAGAAADPARPLSELPLLSPAERRQLLDHADGTDLAIEPARLLHELFERTAAAAPERIALVMGDSGSELTYGELNARANRLARFLVALGAGPEAPVGICLDRSPDMIVALLAALKAGGVYVPLDPAYPLERLEYMLADSGARVLVSRSDLPVRPVGGPELRLALLDSDRERIAAQAAGDLGVSQAPESLAYIIYTSGSTGRPKGVEISHGAIARHAEVAWRFYRHGPGDRVLECASMSFDFSVETIFVTFGAGATLLFRGEEVWAGEALAARITALGATAADLPTPLWHSLALDAAALATAPPSLRLIATGGEEMLTEAARLWGRSPLSAVLLLNSYGPTETVVTATMHEVDPAGEPAGSSVALGRPMPEHTLHVLDVHLELQPVGLEGEIYLGGVMARGYRGRPDLTAASFVPDPFSGRPGERLYRTGDLARRRTDGDVLFLGRRDGQVKLRGFRIETGEIESALLAYPGIREAVVRVLTLGGERRLVAWTAPVLEKLATAELQAFLGGRLPAYMIPTAFAAVAAMPLTPSGKVDRRALPAPVLPGEEGEGRALGPLEELLAGLWRQLLGVERVGAADSFFDLGGHSLIATRLVSRVRSAFGVELPLAAVFEEPTLEGLARRLAAALGEPTGPPAPPIVATPRDPEGEPLSFAQQRLWFLHGLDPESSAYNVPGALLLRGPLRPAPLAAALGEIVRRHEALRTVFRDAPGGPVQVVLPAADLTLPVVDLAVLPADVRRTEAQRVLDAEGGQPFDLAAGPLLRALLIRLDGEAHLLAVMMHHIASDAWSLGVTFRELSALYRAALADEPSPLPELAVQYADFARWQRSWLSGEVLAAELEHWRRALDGAPEALELPTDRPRPAPAPLAGHLPFALPADLAVELRALAQAEGWSLFMALLAAFGSLLARWSGQRDLVVGAPVANRNRQEVEGLIGFFTNTLALRLDLAGDPSFAEVARRARAATLEGYAHQELPFERLVEDLAPERDAGRTPLFQVMLVVQHDPAAGLSLPGLVTELVEIEPREAKFELTLFLIESGGGIAGHLELNRGLFDPATAARLLGGLATLLTGAVADPSARLSELPLLTAAERRELIAWTTPLVAEPPARCLHEWVAERAALHPEAVAVTFEGEQLTYGELARRARALAARLRAAGVGPDVPVGLYLGRSLDMMVAVLGVLMAGGAYVPLDPTYPRERLRLMLEDAGAPVVLTHGPLAATVPEGVGTVLRVDEILAAEDGEEIAAGVDPANLVYVTYTSGSTGRPKGVAMTHAAISAMLAWQLRTSVAGGGRTLQYTSLSFDVSCQEIFATWCAGGTLVLVSEEVRRDPAALIRLLAEERIERLFQPFVALQQLALAAADGPRPASLREVMSAGEQLHVTPQIAALFASLPGSSLYNHYGPSETHAATWLALHGDPAAWPESPTIGGPLDHARVFLLDAGLRPVPDGVLGEVWIGGEGLARGYMRADLTAERFLPDPLDWSSGWEPGSRRYRTGDLARRLVSGELEFLGRRDHQVKVRGHRIETAEVELALARHPAVLQAAVAVRGDSAGARRLVAYVVFREDAEVPASGELRAFLAESLPDPMVPTAWSRLVALPMTPSGKLDRRALTRLHPEESWSGDEGFVAPRTPVEELLAGIWRDVLGADQVGVHDDFFQLGGHSLLATQAITRIRELFGIALPLRRIFEAPTLGALAEAVAAAREEAAAPALPPIRREPREGSSPLSFAQERLWFLHRLQPESPAYNIPLALRAEGALDPARLAAALSEVVRRHEVLRTVFAERDGEPVQVVLPAVPAGSVPLPGVDLRALPRPRREAEARRLAAEEAAQPFDLARGPLLRTLLIELEPARWVLVLNLHHIVTDGWSMGVLVREVKALYAGEPLPEPPVQYGDFALWQRRWLAGETLESQLAWWRERLRGAPAVLDLMTDRPRPPVMTQRGADHRFAFPAEISRGVAELARREGVTPFMVLAAGLFALLSRLTGQRDLTIGSPIANRHHYETEGLIGFFVNTLVLRAGLSRGQSFRDLLRQVRETSLGAFAHQDLPFEKLVDDLQLGRDLSRPPLFQVVLAVQNAPLPKVDLGGVRLTGEEIGDGVAKFDLSFAFTESGDRLAGTLQYATDLFEPSTAVRLVGQLGRLLAAAAARPEAPWSTVELLSPGERHQILREWNDTEREWSGDPALHQLFEAQADRDPEATAVICGGSALSYGELERQANRVAHHLRRLGIGRAEPVGLWMRRSLDLPAALLGILKAGAVYMPLDASWPEERVAAILAGTGARALIAGPELLAAARELAARLPALRHVIEPGELADLDLPESRPAAVGDAGDPAYLIHTSGSTGEPKGIVVRHRSAANTLRWNNETLEIGPGDRHLAVNSIGFDLSIYDLLGMLGAGAAVRIATEDEIYDPQRLAAILIGGGITTWNSAPSALQRLVPFFPASGEGSALRRVLLAGDWIPLALPDDVRRAFPKVLIGNFGGATETSVWSNWHRVDRVDPAWSGIPYGRPLANTRYYILDADLHPCPPGAPGDNYIGGPCVAVGYAGQPALTAASFLPDPYSELPGARMYATGDRARFGPDGTMEFLGRVDSQVKVRGYRIELGEIEAALLRHAGVGAAVVLAREDVPGEKSLVGYVVPAATPAPAVDELRAFLRETLPEYMVPCTFVELPGLPVTANGKLDRDALPAPREVRALETAYVAPRNDLERAIGAVWCEVLQLDRIGVQESFFEVGGNSLLVARLQSRLREATGRDVPVVELFRHPTIESLARSLEAEAPPPPAEKAEAARVRTDTRREAMRQLQQARGQRRGRKE